MTANPARMEAQRLLSERRTYPRGSLDRAYRERAAWVLLQMARGVAVNDYVPLPKAREE